MNGIVLAGFDAYGFLLLPFLIFLARVADVCLGTVRVIFITRGYKYLAPLMGFFEVLIWLMAIGQIMKHLSSPVCYIAYAGGFAMGNFVGIRIAERLSLGTALVRLITQMKADELVRSLRDADFGVTTVDGQGVSGPVKVIFTIVPRREVQRVVDMIKKFNLQAFYTIEEVGYAEKGTFPIKKSWLNREMNDLFRPLFRKGK